MSLLHWLAFLVNFGVAVGFVVLCALYAKRIGGAGPWLLASVGAVDALLILLFRVHAMMGRDPTKSLFDFERELLVLESLDALATIGTAILALVGFALLMTPKRRV